jgi:glycosyltransferase involved in cell wall biosynthesis
MLVVTMPNRKAGISVFISHPSHCLTDYLPHGDGLIAWAFIRQLAARVSTVHVAVPLSAIQGSVPSNVYIHPLKTWARPSPSTQSPLFRLEYAWRIRQLFDRLRAENRIDIIHQLNPGVLGLNLRLYGLGTPLVMGPLTSAWRPLETMSSRPSIRRRIKQQLKRRLLREVLCRADAVLTSASEIHREVQEAGVSGPQILPFPFPVDTTSFSPHAESLPEQPTILFLARLVREKGIYTLLDAFDIVARKLPNARLIVGGGGEEEEAVRQRVAASLFSSRITLLGHIPPSSVCATMQDCSLYCLPSLGEPFGISALEAMACGKALVVTDAGGLPDLVRPSGGLKVPPNDPQALSNALVALLTDKARCASMGHYNRARALKEYSWDAAIDRLLRLYQALLYSRSTIDNYFTTRTRGLQHDAPGQ